MAISETNMVRWTTGPGGIEAYPYNYCFLLCFDTVGWVT